VRVSDQGVAELLRCARQLIESPQKWIQHDIAQDINGASLSSPHSLDAAKFCAVGALCRAASAFPEGLIDEAVELLADVVRDSESKLDSRDELNREDGRSNDEVVVEFQDCHSHQEVLETFDSAIQCAVEPLAVALPGSDHLSGSPAKYRLRGEKLTDRL
jgi:hypothetical protein